MDQRRLPRRAGGGDDAGPDLIAEAGGFAFLFREVDLGVGGRVDDQRRARLVQRAGYGFLVGDVDLGMRQSAIGDGLGRRAALKLSPQLSAGSENEDHATTP